MFAISTGLTSHGGTSFFRLIRVEPSGLEGKRRVHSAAGLLIFDLTW